MLRRIVSKGEPMEEPAKSEPLPAGGPGAATGQRRRRGVVAAVLALAVVTGVVAILSTWVKRQALDTTNWTNTSSQLLANPQVQDAVGAYMVDQLFTNVDVARELRRELPRQAAGLAGPAAAGLQEFANRAAPQLLARPRVQDAWRAANTAAHRQLLQILEGGGATVSTANGQVVLDLHALVDQLARALGVSQQVASARAKLNAGTREQARGVAQQRLGVTLPPSSGRLVIMRSNQLQTAQDIAKAIRGVSIVFTALSLGLFTLAVWLARGWRRQALRATGWCFFGLGLFALLVRRIAGERIVDGLVRTASIKPAAHDAFLIGTSLLRAIALAMVIYGLVLVTAAWLAGPTRPAVAVRRGLAPSLRDHPLRVYAGVGLVYLLVLVWGPTPALRHAVPILLIAALLALGIEMLRRQAATEFPAAQPGDAMRDLRGWLDTRRGPAPVATAQRPTTAGNGNGIRLDQLERLASLHDNGALTDEEYSAEKGLLLRS
jgi:hypothetical protein